MGTDHPEPTGAGGAAAPAAASAGSGTGDPTSPPAPERGPDPSDPHAPISLQTLPWDLTDARDDRSLPPWFRRAVVLVLALVIASKLVVWAFGELASFWYTLFLSFFIGLTLEPLVNRMAARGMRRGLATLLVMLGFFLMVVAFFALFGGLLSTQLAQLIRSVPSILNSLLETVNGRFGTDYNVNNLMDSIGIGYDDIAKSAANVGLGLLSVLTTAVSLLFNLFTIALFTFYFAADGPRFRRTVASWLSPRQQRTFLTVWDISTQKAGGYVISRLVLAVISTAFHGVVFFALDLPYWLPMALWVGLVSQFIPTIGTYLAGALPIVIALVDGSPVTAVIVLLAVLLYQQIENYFVSPRVTQSTLEIHPAVAFGSVLVGSALFGAVGALLAIPVVATIQSLISVYGRRYELVHEFGATPQTSDQDRVAAAMRATEDEVEATPRPRPPLPPRPHAPWPPRGRTRASGGPPVRSHAGGGSGEDASGTPLPEPDDHDRPPSGDGSDHPPAPESAPQPRPGTDLDGDAPSPR